MTFRGGAATFDGLTPAFVPTNMLFRFLFSWMRFRASIWLGVMRRELERPPLGCAALAAERIFPEEAKFDAS